MPITKEIAMSNRRLGEAFEYRQLRKLKKTSLFGICCRSSGSHGLFDLWSLHKTKLRLISVKRNGYTAPKEREELRKFMLVKPDFVQVEVHIYKTPKKIKKIKIRSVNDLKKLNKVSNPNPFIHSEDKGGQRKGKGIPRSSSLGS